MDMTMTSRVRIPAREQQRRARLAGELRRWKISNRTIADRVGSDPSVISHWLAGRIVDSHGVEAAITTLLEVARAA